MGSKTEFINLSGLRTDGRRRGEVRKLNTRIGLLERVDGSAFLEMGNTKVLAVVHGPREVLAHCPLDLRAIANILLHNARLCADRMPSTTAQ
jgi:exosome complex component RRP41